MDTYERLNQALEPLVRGDSYGHAVDVTGATAGDTLYMTLKRDISDTDVNAVAMVVHPITQDDIDAAQPINLWFTPAQMDSLELARHWLDVQIILGDARVYTLMGGSAPVVHDVTRHTSTVPLATGIEILETFTYSSFTVEAA